MEKLHTFLEENPNIFQLKFYSQVKIVSWNVELVLNNRYCLIQLCAVVQCLSQHDLSVLSI